eukprot:5307271-Amphidinium_carterae.1
MTLVSVESNLSLCIDCLAQPLISGGVGSSELYPWRCIVSRPCKHGKFKLAISYVVAGGPTCAAVLVGMHK